MLHEGLCIHLAFSWKAVPLNGLIVLRSCPTLATPWTPLPDSSVWDFPGRQEYWSGLPFPSQGYLPDSGIKPVSLALQADSFPPESSGKSLELWSGM